MLARSILDWSQSNNFFVYYVMIKCRLFVRKFIYRLSEQPQLLELFQNVTGVWFFETDCR